MTGIGDGSWSAAGTRTPLFRLRYPGRGSALAGRAGPVNRDRRARARAAPWSSWSSRGCCGHALLRTADPGCGDAGPSDRSSDRLDVPTRCRLSRASTDPLPLRPRTFLVHRSRRDLLGRAFRFSFLAQRVLDVLVLPRALRALLDATWRHADPPEKTELVRAVPSAGPRKPHTFESRAPLGTHSISQRRRRGTVYIGGGLLALIIIILLLIWIF